MRIPHRFLPSTSFNFILFQYLLPASSQSDSPATASVTTPFPASSSSTVSANYNFTYPTFPDHYGSGIQASYKDTIDVSWTANGAQHSPELEIQCWNRNDSSSFICAYINPLPYPSSPLLLLPPCITTPRIPIPVPNPTTHSQTNK